LERAGEKEGRDINQIEEKRGLCKFFREKKRGSLTILVRKERKKEDHGAKIEQTQKKRMSRARFARLVRALMVSIVREIFVGARKKREKNTAPANAEGGASEKLNFYESPKRKTT